MHYTLQGTLLGSAEPAVDATFGGVERVGLDDEAWVDLVPAWVMGADRLFDDLLTRVRWQGRRVHMYDKVLDQPRLNGTLDDGERPEVVEQMRRLLSDRYDVDFTSVRANLYRDGRDSVAWHADRHARAPSDPDVVIAILSLGSPRRFLLRPRGGGPSVGYVVTSGDLLVMGGACQRDWQHTVPKMAHAGPRLSITFRYATP